MAPLKGTQSAAERAEIKLRRAEQAKREARVAQVGAQVAARAGVMRGSLFDAEDFTRAHHAREQRMETTFSKLYQPAAKPYWAQAAKPPQRKPLPGAHMLPDYVADLPRALSLHHPATREVAEEEEEEPAEDRLVPRAPDPLVVFDPTAVPAAFYSRFKERVHALRENIAVSQPARDGGERASEHIIDAANAAAGPSPTDPAAEAPLALMPPPGEGSSGAEGAGDVGSFLTALPDGCDFEPSSPAGGAEGQEDAGDLEPSLVYTEAVHYLAAAGVDLPTWDDAIDDKILTEIAALDLAQQEAMRGIEREEETRRDDGCSSLATLPARS